MLGQGHVGFGDQLGESSVDHFLSSTAKLLSWLKQCDEGAVPGRSVRPEQACGAHEARDVHVVTACVRDRHDLAGAVGLLFGAGVWETGILFYWQRVHVGAHENGGAVAVLEYAYDAGRPDLLMHFVSRVAQRTRCRGCRLLLLI